MIATYIATGIKESSEVSSGKSRMHSTAPQTDVRLLCFQADLRSFWRGRGDESIRFALELDVCSLSGKFATFSAKSHSKSNEL